MAKYTEFTDTTGATRTFGTESDQHQYLLGNPGTTLDELDNLFQGNTSLPQTPDPSVSGNTGINPQGDGLGGLLSDIFTSGQDALGQISSSLGVGEEGSSVDDWMSKLFEMPGMPDLGEMQSSGLLDEIGGLKNFENNMEDFGFKKHEAGSMQGLVSTDVEKFKSQGFQETDRSGDFKVSPLDFNSVLDQVKQAEALSGTPLSSDKIEAFLNPMLAAKREEAVGIARANMDREVALRGQDIGLYGMETKYEYLGQKDATDIKHAENMQVNTLGVGWEGMMEKMGFDENMTINKMSFDERMKVMDFAFQDHVMQSEWGQAIMMNDENFRQEQIMFGQKFTTDVFKDSYKIMYDQVSDIRDKIFKTEMSDEDRKLKLKELANNYYLGAQKLVILEGYLDLANEQHDDAQDSLFWDGVKDFVGDLSFDFSSDEDLIAETEGFGDPYDPFAPENASNY